MDVDNGCDADAVGDVTGDLLDANSVKLVSSSLLADGKSIFSSVY